jgi:hypothetical protein
VPIFEIEQKENLKIAGEYSNHLLGNFNRETIQNFILNTYSLTGLLPLFSIASLGKKAQAINITSGCMSLRLIAGGVIYNFLHKSIIIAATSILYV